MTNKNGLPRLRHDTKPSANTDNKGKLFVTVFAFPPAPKTNP